MEKKRRGWGRPFKRIRKLWSLDNFDDGYVDNRGRFRVWVPDHPRAYKGGYFLRSIVAYEAYHGVVVLPNSDIHHKNENRLDDSIENLELMTHGEHTTHHNTVPLAVRTCKGCGESFEIKRWRLNDPTRGTFCSQGCFHGHTKGKAHHNYNRIKTECEWCGNSFEHIPSSKRRFCGNSCSANHSWKKRKGGA